MFFKIEGQVITPSLEGSILPGITRESTMTLLRSWGIRVIERRISMDELWKPIPKDCWKSFRYRDRGCYKPHWRAALERKIYDYKQGS